MSIQEWYASECKICGGYSNAGFDLCEECAKQFVVWFFLKHHKKAKKIINTKLILSDKDGLWSYSKVDDFLEKEFKEFKKVCENKFNWYDGVLKKKVKKNNQKGVELK